MIATFPSHLHEDVEINQQSEIQTVITQNPQFAKLLNAGYDFEAAHEYTDVEGNIIYYKIRLKNKDTGDKQIKPVHFDGSIWLWKEPSFLGLKPLYNLHSITLNPNAVIWVCEGEKSVDHLNGFFEKLNIYGENLATTSGGAGTANSADWSVLAHHKVILWPDNDEAGINYCNTVTEKLRDLDTEVSIVDILQLGIPIKGDVVDWLEGTVNKGLADFKSIEFLAPDPQYPPLFDISDASVLKFIETTPPPRIYLLSDCLPLGKVGLLVGMGGVRKSQYMLQLQVAVATGKPLCGAWDVATTGSSLGLYAEEDEEELHRRFKHSTQGFNKTDMGLISEKVFIHPMTGSDKHLTCKTTFEGPTVSNIAHRLITTASSIPNLKLIIIDPVSRFNGGEENSSADMTIFVEACEIVSKATGATVIIVHHVNKTSINSNEINQAAARGSSALTDGVRWQMNINVMAEKEAKSLGIPISERKSYVKVEVTKNNYAPPQSLPIWLELTKPYGILNYAELTPAEENKKLATLSKIIETIKTDSAKGIELSKSAFTKKYAGTTNLFKLGDKSLRGYIDDALDKGLLVLIPPTVPTNNVTTVLALAHKEGIFKGLNEDFSSQL